MLAGDARPAPSRLVSLARPRQVLVGVALGPAGLVLVSANIMESELVSNVGAIGICLLLFEAGMRVNMQALFKGAVVGAAVTAAAFPAILVFLVLHHGLCVGVADSIWGSLASMPACSRVSYMLVHNAQVSGYKVDSDIPAIATLMDVLALNALVCANNVGTGAVSDRGGTARVLRTHGSNVDDHDQLLRRRLFQEEHPNTTNSTNTGLYMSTFAPFTTTPAIAITPSPTPDVDACTFMAAKRDDAGLNRFEGWWPAAQALIVFVLMSNMALGMRQLVPCIWSCQGRSRRWWIKYRARARSSLKPGVSAKSQVEDEVLWCQECDDGMGASYHCQDCSLLLCDDCCKHHRKSRRSKDHTLQNVAEFRRSQASAPSEPAVGQRSPSAGDFSGETARSPQNMLFSTRSPHSSDTSIQVLGESFGKGVKTTVGQRRVQRRGRREKHWDLSDTDTSNDETPPKSMKQETSAWRLSDSSESESEADHGAFVGSAKAGAVLESRTRVGDETAAISADDREADAGWKMSMTRVVKKTGESSLVRWERERGRKEVRDVNWNGAHLPRIHASRDVPRQVDNQAEEVGMQSLGFSTLEYTERLWSDTAEMSPDMRLNNAIGNSLSPGSSGGEIETGQDDDEEEQGSKLPTYADGSALQSLDDSLLLWIMLLTILSYMVLSEYMGSSYSVGALVSGLVFGSSKYVAGIWKLRSCNVIVWPIRIFFMCSVGAVTARTPWTSTLPIVGGICVSATGLAARTLVMSLIAVISSPPDMRARSKWIIVSKGILCGLACGARDEIAYWILLQQFGNGRMSAASLATLLWATAISSLLNPMLFVLLRKWLSVNGIDEDVFGVGIVWVAQMHQKDKAQNGNSSEELLQNEGTTGKSRGIEGSAAGGHVVRLVVAGFTPKSRAGDIGVAQGDILVAFRRSDCLVDVDSLLRDGVCLEHDSRELVDEGGGGGDRILLVQKAMVGPEGSLCELHLLRPSSTSSAPSTSLSTEAFTRLTQSAGTMTGDVTIGE